MVAAKLAALNPLELSHLRAFVSVLEGYERCESAEASADLARYTSTNFTSLETQYWLQPRKGVVRSLRNIGAPCDDTSRWWVPDGAWGARPMYAHCCNQGPAVARCPGRLMHTPGRCDGELRLAALRGACEDDATLLCEPFVRAAPGRPCLVYTFGIADQWSFEEYAAAPVDAGGLGCEVHAFDPTSKLRAAHERHRFAGVTFHYLGLGAKAGGTAATSAAPGYGALGGPVRALDELLAMNGHSDRSLSLVKIDCEGCEWESFVDLAMRAPAALQRVCALVMEVHFASVYQMHTPAQLKLMAAFWRMYIEEAGFRFWIVHRNPGPGPWHGKANWRMPPQLKRRRHRKVNAWVNDTWAAAGTGRRLQGGDVFAINPLLIELGMQPTAVAFEIGLYRPGCGA